MRGRIGSTEPATISTHSLRVYVNMADTEAARSIHDVHLDDKSGDNPLDKARENGYRHLLTEEQELFLNSIEPAEQDKIFRKVRCNGIRINKS